MIMGTVIDIYAFRISALTRMVAVNFTHGKSGIVLPCDNVISGPAIFHLIFFLMGSSLAAICCPI